jgi:hypothetical protein
MQNWLDWLDQHQHRALNYRAVLCGRSLDSCDRLPIANALLIPGRGSVVTESIGNRVFMSGFRQAYEKCAQCRPLGVLRVKIPLDEGDK